MSRLRRLLRPVLGISIVALLCIYVIHLYSPQRVEEWSAAFNIRNGVTSINNYEPNISQDVGKLPATLRLAEEYKNPEVTLRTNKSPVTKKNRNNKPTKYVIIVTASQPTSPVTPKHTSNVITATTSNDDSLQNKTELIRKKGKERVIVKPKGWSYKGPENLRCRVRTLGCFLPAREDAEKALAVLVDSSPAMTDSYCIELCSQRSRGRFILAGVRNGNECRCGLFVGNIVEVEESNKCNLPCSGDPSRKCGGRKGITMLYLILSQCAKPPGRLSNVVTESSVLGCYPKPSSLTSIMEEYTVEEDWAAARCLLHCERVGLVLAVPRHPNLCYCGLTSKSFDLSNPVNLSVCMRNIEDFVMVYRTGIEDMRCGKKRFLKEGEWKNKMLLVTFPGSGNTWLRHLIESVTGIYTGSVYDDKSLQNGGYMGEMIAPASYKIGVVKSHYQSHMKTAKYLTGIIHVFRNPFNAVLSEFNRRKKGHTGNIDSGKFDNKAFDLLASGSYMTKWRLMTEMAIESQLPKLIFSYEDLVNNTLYYTEKMARFIMGDSVNEKDLQDRLLCLRLGSTGQFKRRRKPLSFDPFSNKARLHINEQLEIVADKFKNAGYGLFPDFRRTEYEDI